MPVSNLKKIVFVVLLCSTLLPFVNAPIALVIGVIMANTVGNPFSEQSAKAVKWLLQVSIVGLGFGMNFYSAINAGKDGLIYTVATIVLALSIG